MDICKGTLALFLTVVVAAGADDCICGGEISEEEADLSYCKDCGRLIPNTKNANGIALFCLEEGELGEYAISTFRKRFDGDYKNYKPLELTGGDTEKYLKSGGDLTYGFRVTRRRGLQLFVTGRIDERDGIIWVSAQVFDIETGRVLAGITAGSGKKDARKKVEEVAADLVNELPYRGRLSEHPTFGFPSDIGAFAPEKGGRVEIYETYDYPCRKYQESEEEEPTYWYDLSAVRPKLVLTDPNKYEIVPSKDGRPGRIEILERGGLVFKGNDICYYYPPEITPVKKRRSVYIGGAWTTHSYDYAEGIKSRETAASASITVGRQFDWRFGLLESKLPFRYDFGVTFDAPLNYYYEYGDTYESRGRIMGVYVTSGVGALDCKIPVSLGKVTWLVPWLGVEAEYFLPFGHGAYEIEGAGCERYESKLWSGLLIGFRAEWELPLYLGSRKKWGFTTGVRVYPDFVAELTSTDYSEHFGTLWRFPFGVRYYF